MGLSESDISQVASPVKWLLQSDETKRRLHGLLFEFYSDFVPADGDTPGISQAVLGDYFSFGLTKEMRRLERKKELDEKDRDRLQKLPAEIQKIKDAINKRDNTIAHKGSRAQGLIPNLIVETIEQKATVVLAYYYHWLVEHENTERELQQLHEEWPKSKPPPVPPDVKEIPVPVAIGFQFFVDECSQVKNIKIDGHKRVERWVNEVAKACEQADVSAGSGKPHAVGKIDAGLPKLEENHLSWGECECKLTASQTLVMTWFIKEYKYDSMKAHKGTLVCKECKLNTTNLKHVFNKGESEAWELFRQVTQGFYRLEYPNPK